ncbi:hypothetical protein ACFQU7_37390 [Pseudoroseomonas wenyumeiae]
MKRDAVVVKVTTEDGIVGWGESHHGRAHTAVAALLQTTLTRLVKGMDAMDVVGVWNRIYRGQLASHGMGAGCALAMSGLDMALWDIRAKAAGWPSTGSSVERLARCPPMPAASRSATSRPRN